GGGVERGAGDPGEGVNQADAEARSVRENDHLGDRRCSMRKRFIPCLLLPLCLSILMLVALPYSPAPVLIEGRDPPVTLIEPPSHFPLRVEVGPCMNYVRGDGPFKVRLRVVNTSAALQSFDVWTGSWDSHWRCNNERITYDPWNCYGNLVYTQCLK